MQLLRIVLYHRDGRIRNVDFVPGELNIVTGRARAGKSALLTIVDYCLGRDRVEMPPGPIRNHVAWFGTLWQLDDGSRLFLGRPRLEPNRSETSKMMIAFGGETSDAPTFSNLVVNVDSATARSQVGARIGLVDASLVAPTGGLRDDQAISLGAAALFSFQEQHEIANKALLFHRQGEPGVETTIRDTLPYFLGAMPGDNPAKHAQLRQMRRALRQAQRDAQAARDDAEQIATRLDALLAEANEAGMIAVAQAPSTEIAIQLLNKVRYVESAPLTPDSDLLSQDRRRELEFERQTLRSQIGRMLDERGLLLDISAGEDSFGHAIGQQVGRLSSIQLIAPKQSVTTEEDHCPVCGQAMHGEDPAVEQLNRRLEALRAELETVAKAEPARRAALESIDYQTRQLRERLLAVEATFHQIEGADHGTPSRTGAERREFVRGRIDAILDQHQASDTAAIEKLTSRVNSYQRTVDALEAELDDELADFRIQDVLRRLSGRITEIAQELEVEYASGGVWLELSRLTVVLTTSDGPATLNSMGSGANWVGLHLAVHLALHEHFLAEGRPVPRILMLDQPTQVFYESDQTGTDEYFGDDGSVPDNDHDAVSRMFKLMHEIVERHAPGMQIVVVDHAYLTDEPWFVDSVRHNWRGNDRLVPQEWIE